MAKLQSWRPWRPIEVVTSPAVGPGVVNMADVVALKALHAGEATAEQQKRAVEAMILRVACADEMSFRADDHGGSRESDFSEGKRFVGLQLRKLILTPLDVLTGERRS